MGVIFKMNRFAQVYYGKVIYIYETNMEITELSSIFSPKTYWFDVTGKECEIGYEVLIENGDIKFSKPTTTVTQPTVEERLTSVEDYINAQLS